jgi:hypothetical protein
MARKKKPNRRLKPKFTEGELAEALAHFTDPNHPDYDPEFDKEIRRLRPDWFKDETH